MDWTIGPPLIVSAPDPYGTGEWRTTFRTWASFTIRHVHRRPSYRLLPST